MRIGKQVTASIALAIVVAAGLAACGDDDDDAGTTPQTETAPDTEAPSTQAPSTQAPSTGTTAAGAPAGDGAAVAIANFSFDPASAEVAAGATVVWTNDDAAAHTVTFDDGSADSDVMATGATFAHTFDAAGEFAYHCAIHPSMTGTVTVA